MNCFMEKSNYQCAVYDACGGSRNVVGCVLVPFALSDNYVHSLKNFTHLLLRKLFGIFVGDLYELLDKPIICLPLKWMGEIGPKGLILQIASSSFDSIVLSR